MLGRFALVLALVAAGFAAPGNAQEQEARSSLLPEIPKATGEPHPEGNEYWRRNHMSLMLHDRDLTMHDGDREIGASLKGCFDCHAAKDDQGQIVTYASEQHFCRACHDYVAVKVDCFMCHRSTPDGVDEGAAHASLVPPAPGTADGQDGGSIVAYLQEVARQSPQSAEVSQ